MATEHFMNKALEQFTKANGNKTKKMAKES